VSVKNQADWEKKQAKEIVNLLDKDLATIDPLTVSKLKYAREKALSQMPANASFNHGGILYLLGTHIYQQKVRLMLIGLLLILGVFLMVYQNAQDDRQSDAYLLGSELPPEAYLNEGFDTWLSENSPP
jgi:Protein of unknown function (DUF3619)